MAEPVGATAAAPTARPEAADGPFVLDRNPRGALVAFLAVQLVGLVVFLWAGRNRWFFGDEWVFLVERDAGSAAGLFEPHAEHWTTLPVLSYRLLWNVFGLRTYVPYQLLTILMHLGVALLLRVVMRRGGVSPWMATVAASSFVLFGAGDSNIVRGFQITFDGALLCGLGHLLLADHDGPLDRRDWWGLVIGLAGLMFSGVALAMVLGVGVAVLVRRRWTLALFHTLPLLAVYGLWWWVFAREGYTRLRAPVSEVWSFVVNAVTATFSALGQVEVVGGLLAAAGVVGLVLAWRPGARADVRARAAGPVGLLAALAVFLGTTAWSRAALGADYAEQSRYLHIVAALVLPAVAVGLDALARRWVVLVPVGLVLLVVGIPGNVDTAVNHRGTGRTERPEKELYLAAAHVPAAADAPDWVRPDPRVTPALTLGWLRRGSAAGRIPDPPPIEADLAEALRFRLGLQQIDQPVPLGACEPLTERRAVHLEAGDSFGFRGRELVVADDELRGDERGRLELDSLQGETLVAVAGPLDITVSTAPGAPARVCGLPRAGR